MRNSKKTPAANLKGAAIAMLSVVAAKESITGEDILRLYSAVQNAMPEGYKINQMGTAILACRYFDIEDFCIEGTII